jgi:hypothetical protein
MNFEAFLSPAQWQLAAQAIVAASGLVLAILGLVGFAFARQAVAGLSSTEAQSHAAGIAAVRTEAGGTRLGIGLVLLGAALVPGLVPYALAGLLVFQGCRTAVRAFAIAVADPRPVGQRLWLLMELLWLGLAAFTLAALLQLRGIPVVPELPFLSS